MSGSVLQELELVDVSVAESATFAEAASALCAAGLSAIAVLDGERHVVGLFTEDDLLSGLSPGYLRELRHTAFLDHDFAALQSRARAAASEPVSKHMREPVVLERETSGAHVAERFLHCEWGALAVVEKGTFVGMVRQGDFCRTLLARLDAGVG